MCLKEGEESRKTPRYVAWEKGSINLQVYGRRRFKGNFYLRNVKFAKAVKYPDENVKEKVVYVKLHP